MAGLARARHSAPRKNKERDREIWRRRVKDKKLYRELSAEFNLTTPRLMIIVNQQSNIELYKRQKARRAAK